MNLVTGKLRSHPDGYGFVEPQPEGESVFISPARLWGAMDGDRVVVRVEGRGRGEKKEGSVIRILERARRRVVGKFLPLKRGAVVIPSDEKLQDIMIAPGQSFGAAEGEIVEAEIVRWPLYRSPAMGRITERLGDPRDADVEREVIVRKYGLARRFPLTVTAEAKGAPQAVEHGEKAGRKDLTGLKIFTIDGESARDFDDAVGVERTKDGYRLFVCVADVGHYVRESTALDKEAHARGVSVYFPGHCIPMLPERISNGIASINAAVERLSVTVELHFDSAGETVGTSFYESVIKSCARLTYTKVKGVLAGDANLRERYSPIVEDLETMRELARILYDKRMKEGSIDFDLPEPEVILDIEGRPQDIVKSERNIAHRIIEEFMLAANRSVAEFFSSRDWPFIYRVHARPEQAAIAEFREFAGELGFPFGDGFDGRAFQRLLKEAAGRPEERLINHVLLRSMKQAVYSDKNIGHFGLGFARYGHFTSPIRRYPDLVAHRILKTALSGKYTARERQRMEAVLPAISSHCSERERLAMEAEREIVDLKKAQFMLDKVGRVFDGVISGVAGFGFFVELLDWFVEGFVHVSTLADDYYRFVEKKHSLVGERTKRVFRPGAPVKVKVARVDMERRRVEMCLWGERKSEGRKSRRRR
jgi:ribonuclease R